MNKELNLEYINNLITKGCRKLKSYGIPCSRKDITLLIGKREAKFIKSLAASGTLKTGFDLIEDYGFEYILTNDESRLEICWMIPLNI